MTDDTNHIDIAPDIHPPAGRFSDWGFKLCLGAAGLWTLTILIATVQVIGLNALSVFNPFIIILGAASLLLPGALIALAGALISERQRTAEANEQILQAAARLLAPADDSETRPNRVVDQLNQATSAMSQAMTEAVTSIKDVFETLDDERRRIESVTYANADNTKELVSQLSQERQSLETLAKSLHALSESLPDALPKQTRLLTKSAESFAADIEKAEKALEARLDRLEATGVSLGEKISEIDALAGATTENGGGLIETLQRMDDNLIASQDSVEAACRSSEQIIDALENASQRLAAAVIATDNSADDIGSEPDIKIPVASATRDDENLDDDEDLGPAAAPPRRQARRRGRSNTPTAAGKPANPPIASHDSDSEEAPADGPGLFEAAADQIAATVDESRAAQNLERDQGWLDFEPEDFVDIEIDDNLEGAIEDAHSKQSLSEIIADMEKSDHVPLSREETASEIILRLEESGIELVDAFRTKQKKRAAAASLKGDIERRRIVSEDANRSVDRIRKRLRSDASLMQLASDFISYEQADALEALEKTASSKKSASARLATFLLIDAAII